MVLIKSLFLAGLMFALATGEPLDRPAMATLQVQPNFDFSLTRKEFRVHYSGLGEFTQQAGETVTIKIYNPSGDVFHTYTVDEGEKNQKKAYQFALDNAADGLYQVEVCSGSTCSGKTPALTEIESKQIKLTCEKGRKNSDGTWTKTAEIDLEFKGPSSSDWIKDTEYETIESKINNVLSAVGQTPNYKTDYRRHELKSNPTYKHDGKVFYAALSYNVYQYKDLFDKHRGRSESRSEYSHDFCERKYLLSAHAHLVARNSKEVKYRFKTTLFLSDGGKQMYILGPNASKEKVHVEMTHEGVEIDQGTYILHIIFCATEKDAIESTFCADPVIYDNFSVSYSA